jgi:hypothetical protein
VNATVAWAEALSLALAVATPLRHSRPGSNADSDG